MLERQFDIATADGRMNCYLYAPEEGGPFPTVVLYMDSAGVREPLADLCRRLASAGYLVLMPNLYYRMVRHVDINVDRFDDPAYGATTELMWSLNKHLSNTMVMEDTRAILKFLDSEPRSKSERIGVLGYCMSGPFVYRAAGEFNDRIVAAIAMYGSPLISDTEDSAHLVTERIRGEIYFGFAEHDQYFNSQDVMRRLQASFANAEARVRFEVYGGREHGFVLPGRRVYHKNSAERQWSRVHEIFERTLKRSA